MGPGDERYAAAGYGKGRGRSSGPKNSQAKVSVNSYVFGTRGGGGAPLAALETRSDASSPNRAKRKKHMEASKHNGDFGKVAAV